MSHSHVASFSHIVFGTKDRRRSISAEVREELYAYTGGVLKSQRCQLIKAGGTADHIHLLTELHRSISVASCVQKVKSNTSRWMKEKFALMKKFSWQQGYAAFSVSRSQLTRVRAYIENQEQHHRKRSFKEELHDLLQAHQIDFDQGDLPD